MPPTSMFRGFAFPFRRGESSVPDTVTDTDLIRQSLVQVILTARGERVMRPEFGSNAFSFVFEDNNLVLEELIRTEVMTAIARFEPRVIVQAIDVDPEDGTKVDVTISYVVIATRAEDRVSVTFAR